jgi:hypothetical protein
MDEARHAAMTAAATAHVQGDSHIIKDVLLIPYLLYINPGILACHVYVIWATTSHLLSGRELTNVNLRQSKRGESLNLSI